MHITDFDSSINTKTQDYKECIKSQNPLYLRSMPNEKIKPKNFLNFFKTLYEKNIKLILKYGNEKPIPKIIHQIWFGENFPVNNKKLQESWKMKHPKWEYILWNQDSLKNAFPTGLYNQNMFEQAHKSGNYAKMADIARYEILHEFGGLYVDCDCECFKPFNILNETFDFYAGLEQLANGLVIGNALIGSQPKHPILKQCLINIKEYENKKIDMKYWKGYSGYSPEMEKQYATTLVTTGPILLSKSVWEMADKTDNKDIIFPPTFFFPWAEGKIYPIKPETFSCHYFKGIWKKILKKKYNHK